MTNPLNDVKARADAMKTAVRAITGAPSVGLRDVLSSSIASISNQMLARMQGQNQASQSTAQPGMTSQPPGIQGSQGSRPRVLGTIFRSMFGQRSQQGIPQQQPIQGTTQDARVQPGQPEVVVPPTDLQDAQSKKLRRSRHMSVKATEED